MHLLHAKKEDKEKKKEVVSASPASSSLSESDCQRDR